MILNIQNKPPQKPWNPQSPPQGIPADDPLYIGSQLGTPVYSDLDISAGQWTDADGTIHQYPSFKCETVLFTVNQSKNIIKTPIAGRDGTIKEYIGKGDYVISINGTLSGGNDRHPFELTNDLRRILDAPVAISVNSWFLNRMGIYQIVVEDYNLQQQAGRYSQQDFQINALSDIPVILRVQ